ncbi:MAG: tetratricopeptide repeat protein [Puniceicoccales bacterium]|nr:tetratricopeptide repeat protein [Puniceicoccales bacterium]
MARFFHRPFQFCNLGITAVGVLTVLAGVAPVALLAQQKQPAKPASAAASPVPAVAAQPVPSGTKEPDEKKSPEEKAFMLAEREFQAGKFRVALPAYTKLAKDVVGRLGDPAAYALIQLRIASCYYSLKDWPNAEKEFQLFIEKYPDGVADLIDPNDNYFVTAQIILGEIYANQEKWDLAVKQLHGLSRGSLLTTRDRIRAAIALTRVLEDRNKNAGEAAVRKAALEAISILTPFTASGNYIAPEVREAGERLVVLYRKAGDAKSANALNDQMNATRTGSPLDLAKASFRFIEVGNAYFDQAEVESDRARQQANYRYALACYQNALRNNVLSGLIGDALKIQEDSLLRLKAYNPKPNEEMAAKISNAERERDIFLKVVETFRSSTDYDAIISYRIALCLHELGRDWEAYIAFRDIFENSPKFSKMHVAHFYYILTLRSIKRLKEAQASCREFMTKYPGAPEVGDVAVLNGQMSFDEGDYAGAVEQFRWARDPKNVKSLTKDAKEMIDFSICIALFQSAGFQDWETVRLQVEDFISKYPGSPQLEQMHYLRALCYFYQGKYQETIKGINTYLDLYKKHGGLFVPDARYRLAIARFGVKEADYTEVVIKECEEWLRDYAKPPESIASAIEQQRPEIYALLGDVYFRRFDAKNAKNTEAAKAENLNLAIKYYGEAALHCKTNFIKANEPKASEHERIRLLQTFTFVTKELNSRLVAQGKWGRMLELYHTFYEWAPAAPQALDFLQQIMRASEKLGKTPEARREALAKEGVTGIPERYLTQNADEIFAEAIVRNINNPRQANVELLISVLASRSARKAMLAAKRGETAAGKSKPEDFILNLLQLKDGQGTLIAQARGFYARAELARYMRNDALRAETLDKIANIFKPEELSPGILAFVAEHLFAQKKYARADEFIQYIFDHYRSTDYVEYAYWLRSEIFLATNKPKEAYENLKEAQDSEVPFYTREKEFALLHARILIEVGGKNKDGKDNLEEAVSVLKAIASNKVWRGEASAWALYYQGQIEEKRGKINEAINYYTRSFTAWRKHGVVTAKSYLRVIKLFQKKGDRKGVAGTIAEMLRPDNPASKQPEAAEARLLQRSFPYTPEPPAASSAAPASAVSQVGEPK